MNCTQCGAAIGEDWSHCAYCGAALPKTLAAEEARAVGASLREGWQSAEPFTDEEEETQRLVVQSYARDLTASNAIASLASWLSTGVKVAMGGTLLWAFFSLGGDNPLAMGFSPLTLAMIFFGLVIARTFLDARTRAAREDYETMAYRHRQAADLLDDIRRTRAAYRQATADREEA